MSGGLVYLARCHLRANLARTLVLVACVALALFLPLAGWLLVSGYERDLTARAQATPLVLGAKGNRFDLVLTSLYFREAKVERIVWRAIDELQQSQQGVVIPLHLGFSARNYPIVGTSPEYFELRGLRAAQGTLPLMLGDVCLGAEVARALGLAPGGALFSDPIDLYDISVPPALKMHVCGVLPRTGTADDGAVFVDVKSAWIIEGLAHGHDDPKRGLDPNLITKRTEGSIEVSEAMIEYNEVTPENAASFHIHGELATMPVTGAIFLPDSQKAATMTKARINQDGRWQMVVPEVVVRDLVAFVFKIKALFDGLMVVLCAITAALTALVLFLSARLRQREMLTLQRIGCRPGAVGTLYLLEITFIFVLGALCAAALLGLTLWLVPDPVRWLAAP